MHFALKRNLPQSKIAIIIFIIIAFLFYNVSDTLLNPGLAEAGSFKAPPKRIKKLNKAKLKAAKQKQSIKFRKKPTKTIKRKSVKSKKTKPKPTRPGKQFTFQKKPTKKDVRDGNKKILSPVFNPAANPTPKPPPSKHGGGKNGGSSGSPGVNPRGPVFRPSGI